MSVPIVQLLSQIFQSFRHDWLFCCLTVKIASECNVCFSCAHILVSSSSRLKGIRQGEGPGKFGKPSLLINNVNNNSFCFVTGKFNNTLNTLLMMHDYECCPATRQKTGKTVCYKRRGGCGDLIFRSLQS